jgi:hypothetical protein
LGKGKRGLQSQAFVGRCQEFVKKQNASVMRRPLKVGS